MSRLRDKLRRLHKARPRDLPPVEHEGGDTPARPAESTGYPSKPEDGDRAGFEVVKRAGAGPEGLGHGASVGEGRSGDGEGERAAGFDRADGDEHSAGALEGELRRSHLRRVLSGRHRVQSVKGATTSRPVSTATHAGSGTGDSRPKPDSSSRWCAPSNAPSNAPTGSAMDVSTKTEGRSREHRISGVDTPTSAQSWPPGREYYGAGGGRCLVVVSEFSRDVAHGARTLGQWCPDPPDGRILYLDLETTGLSRSRDRCVMAGLLTLDASGWCLEQAVARAPDEEAAVVEFCDHRMRASDRMVTFNGASFDVPFLRNRAAALGTMAVTEPPHNDLLLYARRQRTQRGLSCSLGALEERMLGLVRVDDPGGAQTGRILRRFLDSPDPRVLAPVLHHNLLDLLSLPPLEELLCPGMISGVPAAGNPRR